MFLSHHTVLEYVVPREGPPGSGLRGGAGVRRQQRLGALLIVVVIISRTSSFGSGRDSSV